MVYMTSTNTYSIKSSALSTNHCDRFLHSGKTIIMTNPYENVDEKQLRQDADASLLHYVRKPPREDHTANTDPKHLTT